MSVKNRKKFFEGLARARALGFRSFQRLYPRTIKVMITASAECVCVIGGRTSKVPAGELFQISEPARAGERVVISKKDETAALSFTVVFEFSGGNLSVSGGDSTDKQARMTFLVPLPSPWAYSQPIKSAFGLDTSTVGVSAYPDCR